MKIKSHKDTYDLNRFVEAQNEGFCYDHALAEIKSGRKTSCWMWFVCPQLLGLGESVLCLKYAIRTTQEASAFLEYKLLSDRLKAILEASLACFRRGLTPTEVYGEIDAKKLQSCTTLFSIASKDTSFRMLCDEVLRYGYEGARCQDTLAILRYLHQRDRLRALSKRQKIKKKKGLMK